MNVHSPEQGSLLEVPVSSLAPGMYVAGLDRPWLDSPFAVQGFFVHSQEDVDYVAQHCAYVYVDPRRVSHKPPPAHPARRARTPAPESTSSIKNELRRAEADLSSASETMERVFRQIRTGAHLDVAVVRSAIRPLIKSVLRNSEAAAILIRLKKKGDYLYGHSLAVSVWSAILGKHMGLARPQLERLALGAALLDVGMTRVDDKLAVSPEPLDDAGRAEVRKHVAAGIKLLKQSGNVDEDILTMVATHHERHDGSGYPRALSGQDIPLFGRIAGLVDSYDAMITARPHASPRSTFEAMQELSDAKDELFQGVLVEQFVQAVGLFPTGSVVQLSSGEIGVIVQQNAVRRLRPKIVVVLDPQGNRLEKLSVIDLAKYSTGHSAKTDLWISKELEPGAHGIHPDEFFL